MKLLAVVSRVSRACAAAALLLLAAAPASAQVDGEVSVILDVLPDIDPAPGLQAVGELRMRIFAEHHDELGAHLRFMLSGYVDGLIAERRDLRLKAEPEAAIIVRPQDLFVDFVTRRFDVRAGSARLVWGRLDEFQPTDVVNPIDLSEFLMEGRSEARLAVGLIRGRVFLPRGTMLEGVVVPAFRSGRFDQLDEPTSPFNLTRTPLPTVKDKPDFGAASLAGGLRLTSTTARVDWSVVAYRGRRTFPISSVEADLQVGLSPPPLVIRESFPRFTMIGGDFETVRGPWGLRGEIAAFIEDELQSTRALQGVPGHSVAAGVGIDRRAGDYRIAANALWGWNGVDDSDPVGRAFVGDDEVERTDLSLVLALDRSFARETRTLRVFGVYDPADATTFTRVIGAVSVRDNVWIEGSGGLLTGSSFDIIGRLSRRDFVYARLKVFF